MDTQPLVSVILPCFNGQPYLEEAIDSILRQSLTNIELIIVDDCSTDNSLTIISRYHDPRLLVIRHEINKGRSSSINDGIKLAKADFIAVMDADDISHPQRLEEQVNAMLDDDDIAVVGTGVKVIDKDGNLVCYRVYPSKDEDIRKVFGVTAPIWPCSQMWRKNKLYQCGLFDENILVAEDIEFSLRLCSVGKAKNLSSILYVYRRHIGGISNVTIGINTFRSALVRKVFTLKMHHKTERLAKLYAMLEADVRKKRILLGGGTSAKMLYDYYLNLGLESLLYDNRYGAKTYLNKARELQSISIKYIILSLMVILPSFITNLLHDFSLEMKRYIYAIYAGDVARVLSTEIELSGKETGGD